MQLDMDLVVDYPDLVYCNECMAAIERFTRALVVDEDTLALDVIKEVGHGGSFLGHKHTFDKFRKEIWLPGLFERRNWDLWEKAGAQDIFKKAEEKMLAILEGEHAKLLPKEVEDGIDQIVKNAQQQKH
jgi:trimethylamine---corrinoid protein Co-methyltransferase